MYSGLILFKEPFRPEGRLSIFAPNFLVSMDGVTGDTEDRALWEVLAGNMQASFGDDARKPYCRGRMYTEGFVDDSLKVWQAFDLF